VKATGASVAIIGCGGLGMIIGGRLRKLGISSILLGGAIQVLFGIRGNRWKNHDIISKFWNDAWRSPCSSEIPNGAQLVEGGCYWI
jgi:ketopantoate reductase